MIPDWVSAIVAIGALVVAVIAERRAHAADARARDALDLQKTIDARQREFCDVSWSVGWDPFASARKPRIVIQNTGLTDAVDVTLVVETFIDRQMFTFDRIDAGENRGAVIDIKDESPTTAEFHLVRNGKYSVHWSSPLGSQFSVGQTLRKAL